MEAWEEKLKESSKRLNLAQERIAEKMFAMTDYELERIERKYNSIKNSN